MSNGAAPKTIDIARRAGGGGGQGVGDPGRRSEGRGSARPQRLMLRVAPRDPRALLILGSSHRRLGDSRAALDGAGAVGQGVSARGAHLVRAGRFSRRRWPDRRRKGRRRVAPRRRPQARSGGGLARTGRSVFSRSGDQAGADEAFARHDRAMQSATPRSIAAGDAILAGRLVEAEDRLRARLMAAPRDAEALRLMADVFLRQGRFADAETLLATALEIEPSSFRARASPWPTPCSASRRRRQRSAISRFCWRRSPAIWPTAT